MTRTTQLTRRGAMGMVALAGLSACASGPVEPGNATIVATGSGDMNPAADGSPRPLTVTVLVLRDAVAFAAANVVALQDPEASFGGDIVTSGQLALTGPEPATLSLPMTADTTAIAAIAGYRDPSGKEIRGVVPVDPLNPAAVSITVGPDGLIVSK